ncbi:MAG: hypothetical protein K6G18_04290 [Treponema sp.]|nr:hypothetical protein [Treponema sp.]
MFSTKRPFIVFIIAILSALFLSCFTSCDDSAAGSDEDTDEPAALTTDSSYEARLDLYTKWKGIIPDGWTRSSRPYSEDNEKGYSADTLINTFMQSSNGKALYMAHNFKDEHGTTMYDDILFYFDYKANNPDGYYIYFNTLPIDEPDD